MRSSELEAIIKRPILWILLYIAVVGSSFAFNRVSGGMTMFYPSIGYGAIVFVVWWLINLLGLWERDSVCYTQVPDREDPRTWIYLLGPSILVVLLGSHFCWLRTGLENHPEVTIFNGQPVDGRGIRPFCFWQDEVVYVKVHNKWEFDGAVSGTTKDGTPIQAHVKTTFTRTATPKVYAMARYASVAGAAADEVGSCLGDLLTDAAKESMGQSTWDATSAKMLERSIARAVSPTDLTSLGVRWSGPIAVSNVHVRPKNE